MAINALNSGAKVWLADLEDANTPHWSNVIGGQVTLFDAIRRRLEFTSPEGKAYRLATDRPLAVIVARPRGWHFDERHLLVDGAPTVGALVDFGLYFFHNARELINRGSGPYFYLPKMESHLEARLWNDVFGFAEERLGIDHGTVRATVLIETIPAAFEMDEILYELRDYASGLNAGRWDYLFSVIKYFRDAGPGFVLPDRAAVTMTAPMMRAYTELLVVHLSPPRRLRDGRDGRLHPQPPRPGGQPAGDRQGDRGQGTRGQGRVRRVLGGPPRPGPGVPGGVRPGAGRPAEPARPAPRRRPGHRPGAMRPNCWTWRRCRARSPRPGCGTTSTWRCGTWRPGWAATARSASTT